MALSYLEDSSPEQILTLWKTLHQKLWSKYSADPNNEKLLRKAMEKYRLSLTAADRAFADVESHLHRADGHDAAWDLQQAAEAERAKEEAETRDFVVDRGFFEYAGGLSLQELQRAYYNDKNFRLKYSVLVRDFGYNIPPEPRSR